MVPYPPLVATNARFSLGSSTKCASVGLKLGIRVLQLSTMVRRFPRYVSYFCNFGFYECNMMHTALKVAAIAFAATVVESLPITDRLDDNVTVPLTCVAVGSLLFPA